MKYLCWDHENQEIPDALTVKATDELGAAEEFAERYHSEDPFNSIDVRVVRVNDGNMACRWVIHVDVTSSPVFTASRAT